MHNYVRRASTARGILFCMFALAYSGSNRVVVALKYKRPIESLALLAASASMPILLFQSKQTASRSKPGTGGGIRGAMIQGE